MIFSTAQRERKWDVSMRSSTTRRDFCTLTVCHVSGHFVLGYNNIFCNGLLLFFTRLVSLVCHGVFCCILCNECQPAPLRKWPRIFLHVLLRISQNSLFAVKNTREGREGELGPQCFNRYFLVFCFVFEVFYFRNELFELGRLQLIFSVLQMICRRNRRFLREITNTRQMVELLEKNIKFTNCFSW